MINRICEAFLKITVKIIGNFTTELHIIKTPVDVHIKGPFSDYCKEIDHDEKILQRRRPYTGFVMFLAAIRIVHHELKLHGIAEISSGLEQVPVSVILLGILLTGIDDLCLTGYDFMALRHLGRSLRPRNVILASLVRFSISKNTGQVMISGSFMRYRFYSLWGLSDREIGSNIEF